MATTNSPSLPNASPLSGPTLPSSPERTAGQLLKLDLANQARLLLDNQRTLDTTAADNQVYRQQARRSLEAQMTDLQPSAPAATPAGSQPTTPAPESTMGDILIDSPTTHIHPAPAAIPAALSVPTPAANGWKVPAVVGTVLLATVGGLTGAALLKPTTTPTTAQTPPAAVKPADPVPPHVEIMPMPTPTAYDAITEQLQADGSWKEIARQHLKP